MMMLAVASISSPARAQSSADEPLEVPVHPAVTTVFHLLDEIEHVRFTAPVAGSMEATTDEHRLHVRPQRKARPGMVVSLEVKTATVRPRFRLRVVRHARDASRSVVVQAAEPQPPAGEPAPEDDTAAPGDEVTPDVEATPGDDEATPAVGEAARTPPSPATGEAPRTPEPAARTAASAQAPATIAPRADREPAHAGPVTASAAGEQLGPVTAREVAGAPRFELAVHALVALPGFTALELAGAQPDTTWRAHRGLGARLTVGPTGGWWDMEATVSGTWLAGALTYEDPFAPNQLAVSGPLLGAELGVRASSGARWRPSLYAGIGAQMHLRRTTAPDSVEGWETTTTMEDGAVLALGVGLHRRIGDVLLGVDVQVRRGGPDDYRSMTALWTVGYRLDPGE